MVKGLSIKLVSYNETIPKLLKIIKFDEEIKKHERIVLKPNLTSSSRQEWTSADFLEPIVAFCVKHKNPGTEVVIAEGCDGEDTLDVFAEIGYRNLAEKYGVGLVDLNKAECTEIENPDFLKFDKIQYPNILLDSFVISLPALRPHEDLGFQGSLDAMVGAYPLRHYKGFFSSTKNKLAQVPIKYQIHDILKCKMPDFTLIDASTEGMIFAGQPIDMDKEAAKLLGIDWKSLDHLRLIDQSFNVQKTEEQK